MKRDNPSPQGAQAQGRHGRQRESLPSSREADSRTHGADRVWERRAGDGAMKMAWARGPEDELHVA